MTYIILINSCKIYKNVTNYGSSFIYLQMLRSMRNAASRILDAI